MKIFHLLLLLLWLTGCQNKKKEEKPPSVSSSHMDSLERILKKFPDSILLREQIVQSLRESGDYAGALRFTVEAIEKDSLAHRWYAIKATLDFENKDTAAAIQSLENAINILPSNEYLIRLGFLYAQTGRRQAIPSANLLLMPENNMTADAYLIQGLYYNNIHQPDSAIMALEKCIKADYTRMEAYREKAIAQLSQSNPSEALSTLERAIKLSHNYEEAYYYQGICYERLKKKEEAIIAYKTAWALDNEYVEAIAALKRLGVEFEN
jgi:tetratricopeptide (TPR) repeat protein